MSKNQTSPIALANILSPESGEDSSCHLAIIETVGSGSDP
jgi:hypothetical protein